MFGGGILKDESMDDVFLRLTKNELGIMHTRINALFLGPFVYFYADYVFGLEHSTHYIVLEYENISDL